MVWNYQGLIISACWFSSYLILAVLFDFFKEVE